MNEVNKLIWPNKTGGIGIMSPAAFKRTAAIAYKFKVIKKPATSAAYRTDLSKKAVAALKAQGVDVTGESYKPARRQAHRGRKVDQRAEGGRSACPCSSKAAAS